MPRKFFVWSALLTIFGIAGTGVRAAVPFVRPEGVSQPLTLALKYVSYLKADGQAPITSQLEANGLVERINEIYAPCQLQFLLEAYVTAEPQELGLRMQLASMADLDPTRRHFDEPNKLVIINTGEWNHKGMGTPNAWTAMPGSTPSGTVIEGRVAAYPEMIAHELGHYLNLDHVKDAADLMHPVIYRTSTRLSPGQCENVRKTATTSRALALR